ncbi:hypothetical protein E4T48_07810 [Aureobasidium sp. EXF-10727]|nr:hypothetical protein E4T48_07810 [Aureobasidium sp. EXF-10727]
MSRSNIVPAVSPDRNTFQNYIGAAYSEPFWVGELSKLKLAMPEFFTEYENGHPRSLAIESEVIEQTLQDIRGDWDPDRWQVLRDQIKLVVERMSNVKTMFCLGLGRYTGMPSPKDENPWVVQYALFVYIWEEVNKKRRIECEKRKIQFEPVKRYFKIQILIDEQHQSPNIVLADGGALQMIKNDTDTLVFGPHLPATLWPQILALGPQVLISNSYKADGGRNAAAMATYMEETKITNSSGIGPEVKALMKRLSELSPKYHQTTLDTGPVYEGILKGLTIYERKP